MLIFGKHGSGLKFDAELRFDGHNYQKCFFKRDMLSLNSSFLHIFLKEFKEKGVVLACI